MAQKYIKVYIPEGQEDLLERIKEVKGGFSGTLFCLEAIKEKVIKLEKKRG